MQILSALIGAAIVYAFGLRKLSVQLRNAFIEKQLAEFYSPIAGYRKRILTKSELREKISNLANESWQDICAQAPDPVQIMNNNEELFAPYKAIIEYDNQQFREELMPFYRKMLDVFTDKYWLADEATRAYYQEFLEFVEIWERSLAEAIPGDIVKKLGHTESKLHPFYGHIEQKLTALQKKLRVAAIVKRLLLRRAPDWDIRDSRGGSSYIEILCQFKFELIQLCGVVHISIARSPATAALATRAGAGARSAVVGMWGTPTHTATLDTASKIHLYSRY